MWSLSVELDFSLHSVELKGFAPGSDVMKEDDVED